MNKIYKKIIHVTEEDCKSLIDHSPTTYLHGDIKCIKAVFDNGYEVVIDIAPTFELEDDFAVILFGKHGEFINKEYYEDFQDCWIVTNPHTHEIYKLYTEVE